MGGRGGEKEGGEGACVLSRRSSVVAEGAVCYVCGPAAPLACAAPWPPATDISATGRRHEQRRHGRGITSDASRPTCRLAYYVAWPEPSSGVCVANDVRYERSAIERWLSAHATSPMSRAPMAATLLPNNALRNSIEARPVVVVCDVTQGSVIECNGMFCGGL